MAETQTENRTPAALLAVGVVLILVGAVVWFLRWQASLSPYAFHLIDSRWTASVILGVAMVVVGALLSIIGIAGMAFRR